jgi:hypothetical protein
LVQSKSEKREPGQFNLGPLPLEADGITPEQEAEMNRAAVEEVKARRGKR